MGFEDRIRKERLQKLDDLMRGGGRTLLEEMFDDWDAGIDWIARECWNVMDDNEKSAIRFGLLPARVVDTDAIAQRTGVVIEGDNVRKLAVRLYDMTEEIGGMIV